MNNKQIINMICAYKGISQAQAARLAGRPAQSFNHSIKHNNISLDDFIKLCALTGMTIDIKDAHNNNIVLSLSANNGGKTGKTDGTPPADAESGKDNTPTK